MIPQSIRVSWGAGALGVALLMNAIGILALFYMVNVLGMEPALAGTLYFLTKLLDIVSDPVVGSWSDRIKSPAGRRRPFMLAGAFVSACSFVLIFTTPIFAQQWLTAAYIDVNCRFIFGLIPLRSAIGTSLSARSSVMHEWSAIEKCWERGRPALGEGRMPSFPGGVGQRGSVAGS